jgi:hypothetical protein
MLSEAFYVKSNSRLGCQIPITSLEGLELELARKIKSVTFNCDAFFNLYVLLKLRLYHLFFS